MADALHDRNYYRMLDDEEIIELARASQDEMTIELADRLELEIDYIKAQETK